MRLKIALIFVVLFSFPAFANLEKSVVRISSHILKYDYKKPWENAFEKEIIGSGVIINNHYILTAAHVVLNARTITLRKSQGQKKYYAKVKYISYQADLALLEVYDKSFFEQTKALNLSLNVKAKEEVNVAGYPLSRKDVLIKRGSVSKLEYSHYSISDENLLSLELNVSISAGNSGGPVLNQKGDIIGIAMQIPKDLSNKAYAIPSFVIKTFLEDIKDGKRNGFHSNANAYQYLNNGALKNYYGLQKAGVLVTNTDINETQLKLNDIILKINGLDVSKLSLSEFFMQFHIKSVGKTVELELLRNNETVNVNYLLSFSKKLVAQEFDSKPRYFIFGGLVFAPITRNYLQDIRMKQYEMNMLFYAQKVNQTLQEKVVWIENKFPHKINEGYDSKVEIVSKVNGIKVKNFKHFVQLIDEIPSLYVIIELLTKQRIVFNKEAAINSFKAIQKEYKIKNRRM